MKTKEQISKVYNVIILDESGSMSSIYEAALSGTNEVLQGIGVADSKHPDLKQQVQLVTFDSTALKLRIAQQPWKEGMQLETKDYSPCASTPLYDAIGATLSQLEAMLAEDNSSSVVATIITDGYENASQEYSQAAVAALIQRLRSKGWQIIFMGANVDVEALALRLNIEHKMRFSSSQGSTGRAFTELRDAKMAMYKRMSEEDYAGIRPEEKDALFSKIDGDVRDEEDKAPKKPESKSWKFWR